MALIATQAGWEKNSETQGLEYVVRLVAQRKEDVPELNAGDVWSQTPLSLSRVAGTPVYAKERS